MNGVSRSVLFNGRMLHLHRSRGVLPMPAHADYPVANMHNQFRDIGLLHQRFWDSWPAAIRTCCINCMWTLFTQNHIIMMRFLLFSVIKKRLALITAVLSALCMTPARVTAQGPFPPAAGQPGSTAIHKDHASFKTWASGVQIVRGWVNIADTSVYAGGSNKASFGRFSEALGQAEGTSTHVVSLGDAGMATLTFDRPILNGPGFDFAVFENSFSDTFLELAFVEVSSDGQRFVRFPAVSLTQTQTQLGTFDPIDPTKLHNLAGKYRQGYGTPFDLSDLADSIGLDLNNVRFVRIIDAVGSISPAHATFDSQGNAVNDPFPTPFNSSGFDLDAVGVINHGEPFRISRFDHLPLAGSGYWNGSNGSGGFSSGNAFFPNNYYAAWGSWNGWAYSNMRDVTTPGWANQYSAITAGGMSAHPQATDIFALAYVPIDFSSGNYSTIPVQVQFANDSLHVVNGLYVTNSTTAALSMRHGDSYAKKFGGPTGNDPDYFLLKAFGLRADNSLTQPLTMYLADYRFDDNRLDYIVNDWRWFDLSSLGPVKGLRFDLVSSDVGAYGMNTPAYFCIDNLSLSRPLLPTGINTQRRSTASVWPNPFASHLYIHTETAAVVKLIDYSGKKLSEIRTTGGTVQIDTTTLKSGAYVVQVQHNEGVDTFKLIKP